MSSSFLYCLFICAPQSPTFSQNTYYQYSFLEVHKIDEKNITMMHVSVSKMPVQTPAILALFLQIRSLKPFNTA